MLISIANNLTQINQIQQTYLQSNVVSGAGSVSVKNIAGFVNGWAVQIGQTGEETAEIINLNLLNGVTNQEFTFGTSLANTAGTLLFNHNNDAPIYQVHYDSIVVNRSTSGSAGTFSPIGTIPITPDSQYTNYDDSAGAQTYAYYTQYYNSLTGDLSGSSSIFVPGGPTFYSLQKLRQRVKDKLYSAGYIRDDSLYTDWVNEWYELMSNAAIKVNQDYLLGTNQYTFGTNGLGTVTDPYFKPNVVKVEVTWDGVNYLQSSKLAVREYTEQDYLDFPISEPQHAWIGETVFEILPHSQGGTAKLTYPQRFVPLVNDTDEITQTLKAYTTSCVEYCQSVAYGLDGKDAESQQHYQQFMQGKQDFIAEITPRDETGAQLIDIVQGLSGMQEDVEGDIGDFVY